MIFNVLFWMRVRTLYRKLEEEGKSFRCIAVDSAQLECSSQRLFGSLVTSGEFAFIVKILLAIFQIYRILYPK